MRDRADEFGGYTAVLLASAYRGRGVVIAGGGDRFFASLYITVRALRHVGCTLPIQVWYMGRKRKCPNSAARRR